MANHWYDLHGEPVYQVPNKSKPGTVRDTTLSDARKLKLVKSVTTVFDVLDKQALRTWQIEQIKKEVFTSCMGGVEFTDEEQFEKWWRGILYDSGKIGRASAERGAELHNALEEYYLSNEVVEKEREFIEPVIRLIQEQFKGVRWVPEQSFASKTYGFGGRVDMYSPDGIILDFKTKATSDIKKMKPYDAHHMQTAAYAVGLAENLAFPMFGNEGRLNVAKNVKRYNLFISTEKPGLLNLTESTDFDRDWGMFDNLNRYWDLMNSFKVGVYDVNKEA